MEKHTPRPIAIACEGEAGEEEVESEAAPGQIWSQAEPVVEIGRLRLEVVEADQVVLVRLVLRRSAQG